MKENITYEAQVILGEAKMLLNEIENNATLPERAKLGMTYAIEYLLDDAYECLFEVYINKNYNTLRESFEDSLKGGNYHCPLSEVDDGRLEFQHFSFQENHCYDPNDTSEKKIKNMLEIIEQL